MPISGRKLERRRTGRAIPRVVKPHEEVSDFPEDEETTKPAAVDKDEDEPEKSQEEKSVHNDDDKISSGEELSSKDDVDGDEDFSAGNVDSDEDDSEDEEVSAEPPKRARTAAHRTSRRSAVVAAAAKKQNSGSAARTRRGRPKKNESTDEEEECKDESSEENEALVESKEDASTDAALRRSPRGRKSQRKRNTRPPLRKVAVASRPNRRRKNDDSEDEQKSDEDESSEGDVVGRSNKRRKMQTRRHAPKRARAKTESSESESDNGSNPTTPTRRPRVNNPSSTGSRSKRASAQKAIATLSNFKEANEDGDEDAVIPKSFRKNDQDDEDFEDNGNGEEDEEDDEEQEYEKEDEFDEDELQDDGHGPESKTVGLVKEDDIGSAEESEEEITRPHRSPRLITQHQSPSRIGMSIGVNDDSNEDPDNERKQPAFSHRMPSCPSERDAITDEELPEKHVCFFSPDGKSRQCFALETLHKISTSTVCAQIRQDLSGRVVQTFLQPPHFRSAGSDDLLDQIASRFGRDALDLHGDYYKRKKEEEKLDLNKSEGSGNGDNRPSLEAAHDFVKQVQNYVRAQMGSRDLYVCPLCYVYARRKHNMSNGDELDVNAESEETDETLHELYMEADHSDPMGVLEHLDRSYSDSFLTASSFCFPTAAAVKRHLREVHGASTKNIEGNDLYKRFQVRTTDGLLQRFLKTRYRHVDQGAMQSYWFSGNNFDFVYLCSLVDEAAVYRDIVARAQHEDDIRDGDRAEAESFLERCSTFFGSFEKLANRLWDLISDPFRQTTGKELKDFLADDNAEDEGNDSNFAHHQLDLQLERSNREDVFTEEERQRIARYKREEGGEQNELDDLKDSDDESEEENVEIENSYTSSSEEDEWDQAINSKRKAKFRKQNSPRRRRSRTRSGATAHEILPAEDEGIESPSASPGSRRRLVIMDEDEE